MELGSLEHVKKEMAYLAKKVEEGTTDLGLYIGWLEKINECIRIIEHEEKLYEKLSKGETRL